MKGAVYHNRWVCRLCREGKNENTLKHPHHYIQICLSYLRTKPFKLSGKEKGKPFHDGIEAYIYLREIQEAIEEKSFIPWNYRNQVNSVCLFGNFYKKFKESRHPQIGDHLHALYNYDMKDIDRIVLKKFYRNLASNLKTSTKNLILRLVHATLKEAYQEGVIDFMPAFPKIDRAEKPVKNWLTREEQLAVIKELPERLRLLFLFLAYHGKRINEALSIRWEDVDFKQKIFRVYESKVKNEQWLPLHDVFLNALPVAGVINKTGKLFEISYNSTLNQQLKGACKRAGVKKVTTHEFGRHSFVSQGLAAGLTNEQIALITNNLANIAAYSHMDIESKRKIINLLP